MVFWRRNWAGGTHPGGGGGAPKSCGGEKKEKERNGIERGGGVRASSLHGHFELQ